MSGVRLAGKEQRVVRRPGPGRGEGPWTERVQGVRTDPDEGLGIWGPRDLFQGGHRWLTGLATPAHRSEEPWVCVQGWRGLS